VLYKLKSGNYLILRG